MLLACALAFSFGLATATPLGSKTEGKETPEELIIRLVLRVHKTEDGAKLVVNLEESPSPSTTIRSMASKPLISLSTDLPLWKHPPENNRSKYGNGTSNGNNITTEASAKLAKPLVPEVQAAFKMEDSIIRTISPSKFVRFQTTDHSLRQGINQNYENQKTKKYESRPNLMERPRPNLDFKISLGGSNGNNNPCTADIYRKPATEKTTGNLAIPGKISVITQSTPTAHSTEPPSEILDYNDNSAEMGMIGLLGTQWGVKAVADQGFGVLASRCASFAPGLVSDGAGGCTKAANLVRRKTLPGTYTYRNELRTDVKLAPRGDGDNIDVRVV